MVPSNYHQSLIKLAASIFVAVLPILSICTAAPVSRRQPISKQHVALFTFGDSLYDPGNNNYINTTTDFQANFSPYGETFFNYPTGRFSDGRLIPDFVAEYANLPIIPAYLLPGNHDYVNGANFASGGGGALSETYAGLVISLETQLQYFKDVEKELRKKIGKKNNKQLLRNAVYLLNVGGNDYLSQSVDSIIFSSHSHAQQIVGIVLGNITQFVKGIHGMGGRKFGFLAMGSLGCVPNIIALESKPDGRCMEKVTRVVKLHTKGLLRNLKKLEDELRGFKYSFFDIFTEANKRINNPSKYGFKDGKIACCGSGAFNGVYSCGGKRGMKEYNLCKNPNEYFFFDSFHPSEMANSQLAQLMWNGSSSTTYPYNLKYFFNYNN